MCSWCDLYKLNHTRRHEVNLYEEDGSIVLAKALAHRLQHFYDIYLYQDDESYDYKHEDIASWTPPDDFTSYLARATKKQLRCAHTIEKFVPRRAK